MKNKYKEFTILIGKIGKIIKKLKSEEMKEYGLNSLHVSCIYYLYIEKSLTSKEISDMCNEDKGAISRALEYLEKNGFITCEDNNKKRYRSQLFLTDKGKDVGEIISNKINNLLEEASRGVTEENRKIMYQTLSLICDNLYEITNK